MDFNHHYQAIFKAYPDRVAGIDVSDNTITFAQFENAICSIASKLIDLGVGENTRICFAIPNEILCLAGCFAGLRLGAFVVFSIEPDALVKRGIDVDLVISLADAPSKETRWEEFNQSWLSHPHKDFDFSADGGVIAGSSGSTGFRKYVIWTQEALMWRLLATESYREAPTGTSLMGINLYTSYGGVHSFWVLFHGQGVMFPQETPEATLTACQANNITEWVMPPLVLHDMVVEAEKLQSDLSMLQYINTGGAKIPAATLNKALEISNAKIVIVGGSAEIGYSSIGQYDPNTFVEGFAGKILDGVEIEVIDDAFQKLKPEELGSIRIRLPDFARSVGYLESKPIYTEDGWFYSGDTGWITEDGMLIYQGRVDFLLNLNGDKFAPEIIEAYLASALGLTNSVALSVSQDLRPDKLGLLIEGYADKEADISRAVIDKFGLGCEVDVKFVDQLPKNISGKLDRNKASSFFGS